MITLLILILKIYFYMVIGSFIMMWKLFKKLMWMLFFLIGFWLI